MREMDYDIDIAKMDVVQENAKKLFKQSEPLMLKVHELNPEDKRALEGLEGIYYGLNDNERMLVYRKKKEALNYASHSYPFSSRTSTKLASAVLITFPFRMT